MVYISDKEGTDLQAAETSSNEEAKKAKKKTKKKANKEKKKEKKAKKEKKRRRKDREAEDLQADRDAEGKDQAKKKGKKEKKKKDKTETIEAEAKYTDGDFLEEIGGPGSISSALIHKVTPEAANVDPSDPGRGLLTLLLFYQYVEPVWDQATFQSALRFVDEVGQKHSLTGRMRIAREGLNCTLTGSYQGIRGWCRELRKFGTRGEFSNTEFKLTDHLPLGQKFPKLNAFEVTEIVNYGLGGTKAPPIGKTGIHLEPEGYHAKMGEKDTVIIDVRNHYEANIGKFVPPDNGAKYIDPHMRKSTEFPVWLDKPETKELLKGKQVLMYCTGGVRCERASALLRHKMETEKDVKDLGIKGVYQLQGGVDKYFKHYPDGGNWKGKNYVFDKRFAHAPAAVEGMERAAVKEELMMGNCEACGKNWDRYRGKRRCPTCGVPSLVCYDCFKADKDGIKKLGREVQCDLCVEEGVRSKRQLRDKEQKELEAYHKKLYAKDKELGRTTSGHNTDEVNEDAPGEGYSKEIRAAPNPEGITTLHLRNMCNKRMDEATLVGLMPGVTHIQWLTDWRTGKFLGSANVEMATSEDAAQAVAMDGTNVFGRTLRVIYQKSGGKDLWPPPGSEVGRDQ